MSTIKNDRRTIFGWAMYDWATSAYSTVIAGAILSFAKAMGEFGATITFVSNIPGQTQTLASAIYLFLQVPGGEASAIRLAIISIFLALGALIASEILARRVSRKVAGQ